MQDFKPSTPAGFLRYATPGIVLLVEFALLATIANPEAVKNWFKETTAGADFEKGIVGAVLAIVASGGVGYVLSVIYNFFVWLPCLQCYLAVDYRPFLDQVVRKKHLLALKDDQDIPIASPKQDLSGPGAWRIVTGIWHARMAHSKTLENSFFRCEALANLMHGAGAATAASVLAMLFCLFASKHFQLCIVNSLCFRITWIGLLTIHVISYLTLRNNAQGVVELILHKDLATHALLRSPEFQVTARDRSWWWRIKQNSTFQALFGHLQDIPGGARLARQAIAIVVVIAVALYLAICTAVHPVSSMALP